jgi:hypothetical protein
MIQLSAASGVAAGAPGEPGRPAACCRSGHPRGRGREGHPRVGSSGSVDGPPGGKGRQCLLRAGAFLPSQQVTGRDNLTVGAGA